MYPLVDRTRGHHGRSVLLWNIDAKIRPDARRGRLGLAMFMAAGPAVGDLFNDGKLDVVITSWTHPACCAMFTRTPIIVELKLVGGPKGPL
jgi:hypothetical protein